MSIINIRHVSARSAISTLSGPFFIMVPGPVRLQKRACEKPRMGNKSHYRAHNDSHPDAFLIVLHASSLEQDTEPSEQAGGNNNETIGLAELERARGGAAGRVAATVTGAFGILIGFRVTKSVEDLGAVGGGAGSGSGHRRGGGGVDPSGLLSTAGVVLGAAALARRVAGAPVTALDDPLLAHMEGQRQGVLGHVGLLVVAAEAPIGEGFL